MKTNKNNTQQNVLGEETKETPLGISKALRKSLPLMSCSQKLKLRKTRQV